MGNEFKKGDENMAVRKEDLKDVQATLDRKKRILEMTARACDKNDAGLRRLSKS
ncbi:hypothetical protein ACK8P5_26395 (plasmid) [Paenibacillus sp. EC2-1]|uniref:hypothetical protein n=1 Tax=Paenibacillus sp. EC2-1 TaxID=3388665 RepID=UPI003BEF1FE5